MSKKDKYILIIFTIIVGSGLAIFVWNLANGVDLRKTEIDMSAFSDENLLSLDSDAFYNPIIVGNDVNSDANNSDINEEDEIEQLELQESIFDKEGVYFKKYFRRDSAILTNEVVSEFLEKYELGDYSIENLEAESEVEVEVPVENREEVLAGLANLESVDAVKIIKAPIWVLRLKSEMYESGVTELLSEFSDVRIVTDFDEELEYVVRVNFENKNEEIEKELEEKYGDVIYVKVKE